MYKKLIALAISTMMVLSMAACSPKPAPAPATDAPKTDAPAADAPKTDAPAADAPKADTATATSTPRNETLYINGLQWGPSTNANPVAATENFPIAKGNNRSLLYEMLFNFNPDTAQLEPSLAKSFTWTDDKTLTITMDERAHWNDGSPLTADDAVYSYEFHKRTTTGETNMWDYIDSVSAPDAKTFVIKLKADPYNRLMVLNTLQNVYIMPKAVWTKFETDNGGDLEKVKLLFNENPIGSGPYKLMFHDDTKIVLVRDDNYWGVALYGSLPAPKYITHNIYKSNDDSNLAFANGEVDVSQNFIPQVWKMWDGGKPYGTYIKDAPYYAAGSMPSIVFNTTVKGLDNKDVRRAIAMSIDYEKVAQIAMSGYSKDIQPSLFLLNNASEAAQIDNTPDLQALRWKFDVDGANALLDKIGAKKGADGIRVLDGTRLGPWKLECPYGWSDWNASLEIVAQAGKKIGIDFQTNFPDAPVWTNDQQTGKFDILMYTYQGSLNPAQPWARALDTMSSVGGAPIGELTYRNFGRFKDDRADQILKDIPTKTDPAELKKLYTELEKIYLENVVNVPLMYRPTTFETTYEGVWTGFPKQGDGSNISSEFISDGSGVKALYKIKPTGK